MKTGDIVFHQKYGVGRIINIDGLTYLVYYYKENPSLHSGAIGLDFHYWWNCAKELKPISSVRTLIKRRQHG